MNAPADRFLSQAPMLENLVNIEAERFILGALLLDAAAFDRVSDKLKPEHFSVVEYRVIYAEIMAQAMATKPFDIIIIGQSQRLQIAGVTFEFLNNLVLNTASSANIYRHAQIVVDLAKCRDLAIAGRNITQLSTGDDSAEQKLEAAQQALSRLVDDSPRDEWVSAADGMLAHFDLLQDRADGTVHAWSSGLADLDVQLEGGFRPGELVIIGARPSMGKTALALSIGAQMAADYAIGFLSMEMPLVELKDRLVALLGRVSLSHVKRPGHDRNSPLWDAAVIGTERAKNLNLYISDQPGLTIGQVRLKARNLKRLHGLNVLIVDYIGLMTGSDSGMSRAYQLEEISRGLKNLAKELQICVVCLAQLNRKVDERIDSMPHLSDLRDSGAIEQDADVVIFLHRPIQSKPDLGEAWRNFSRVSVAKNRNGPCGVFRLHYLGEQTRFSNWFGVEPERLIPKRTAREFD